MEKIKDIFLIGVHFIVGLVTVGLLGFLQVAWHEMKLSSQGRINDADLFVSDGWLFALAPILVMSFVAISSAIHLHLMYRKVFGVSFKENRDARQLTVQQLTLMHQKAEELDLKAAEERDVKQD